MSLRLSRCWQAIDRADDGFKAFIRMRLISPRNRNSQYRVPKLSGGPKSSFARGARTPSKATVTISVLSRIRGGPNGNSVVQTNSAFSVRFIDRVTRTCHDRQGTEVHSIRCPEHELHTSREDQRPRRRYRNRNHFRFNPVY